MGSDTATTLVPSPDTSCLLDAYQTVFNTQIYTALQRLDASLKTVSHDSLDLEALVDQIEESFSGGYFRTGDRRAAHRALAVWVRVDEDLLCDAFGGQLVQRITRALEARALSLPHSFFS